MAALYRVFGAEIKRMSAWRDVQEQARQLERERHWKSVRALGIDGAYVRGRGKTQLVMVGYVDKKDPQAVKNFLELLVQRLLVSHPEMDG